MYSNDEVLIWRVETTTNTDEYKKKIKKYIYSELGRPTKKPELSGLGLLVLLIVSELLVNVPSVKLASPHHQNQRNQSSGERNPGRQRKRLPVTLLPETNQLLHGRPVEPLFPQLLQRLFIVQLSGDLHVQNVRPQRARDLPEVEQSREIFEPKQLRNYGEQQWKLSPEGEPDYDRRQVDGARHREGDQKL
ncbi:uncharacterized protein LOC111020474, partial [Momordica charantia]|uniref:Uncharacterized protein LOC111020474 n=1 Tax=Momordica charantia TaxID=3673 RepID=A0A6J1DF47_MOMCH